MQYYSGLRQTTAVSGAMRTTFSIGQFSVTTLIYFHTFQALIKVWFQLTDKIIAYLLTYNDETMAMRKHCCKGDRLLVTGYGSFEVV